ncbi:Uncharacterized protein putative lipoprotein-like protein [Ancylobacter novellus DSM 506]|uniref:Uncharacterized protein putative lipoprotein-like protein n=1 Tax=Ancylobacter novellus (strain ATCC 8093 / DSM 506 / JCM 20403 / CCM 1077 / IAM 12100 / NBRC 12443 / NCIMB 10456) TaxID=639283 RepID=D7A8W6_ANCN5|nr:hypothetical protein [Ancylobacter novellus]ADH88671.1 Uncharacterized protein putative lipoprotein-like protein [Ancylobacter novellus DSM 506]
MKRTALLAAALAGIGLSAPAHAASFDCGKAQAADERAVCADPALSALDSEMGGLWFAYGRLPMLMGANGNRHDEARAFLTSRAACGANATCLTALYQARIAALKQQITAYIKAMPPL